MSALDPAVQAKLEEFGDVELELMTLQLVQWKFAGTLPPDDQERAATLLDRFLELALELATRQLHLLFSTSWTPQRVSGRQPKHFSNR
jgi:hypothetical protein